MAAPVRHLRPARRRTCCDVAFALALAVLMLAGSAAYAPAPAQQGMLNFPPRPKPPARQQRSGQDQMLVRAEEINYDYTNERVSAVGNVQIY
jgi:LPS-assembly protein